jgi:protein SCO1
MNRIVKVVILLLMLAIPIGIILFLHSFGRNEYTLPVFYEEGMKVCDTSTTLHTIPDFTFFSPIAGKITTEVLEEKISVVNFFEAGCKGDCPSVFDALANLQSDFATNDQVQIISISTGLVLKDTLLAFAQKYKSDAVKWLYLIEKQAKVLDLAKCGFGLDEINDLHPLETVVLIDDQKRIRGYYNIADAKEADRLVLEIRILLHRLKT